MRNTRSARGEARTAGGIEARVGLVIPCFDAAGYVGKVVAEALGFVPDVLVVDDGSCDGSGDEAASAGARVYRRETNGGKGSALRDGFRLLLDEGNASHIILMDADGQHAPSDLPKFIEAARRGDPFVIGSRLGDRDKIPANRYWANFVGAKIHSQMTGQTVEDSQSGFRMIAAPVLRLLLPSLHSTGYAIESEILIKCAAMGVPFSHVPIETIYGNHPTHYRVFWDTLLISFLSIRFKILETD